MPIAAHLPRPPVHRGRLANALLVGLALVVSVLSPRESSSAAGAVQPPTRARQRRPSRDLDGWRPPGEQRHVRDRDGWRRPSSGSPRADADSRQAFEPRRRDFDGRAPRGKRRGDIDGWVPPGKRRGNIDSRVSPEKRRGDIDGSVPPQNRQPSRVANDEDAYGERPLGETDGQQHVDEDRAAKDFATQATQAGSARDEPKAKVKSFKMMLDGTITSGMLARVQESKTINRDIYYFDVGYNRQATVRPQNGTGHIELMSLLKVGDVVDDLVLWRRDKSLNAGVNLDALKAVVQKRRVAKKKSMDEVVEGTVVTGKLVSIKLHERRGRLPIFFFDVGFEKPAALIAPARNVTLKALTSALKPGDVLEGLVLKKSRGRLMAEAQIKSLEAFCANRDVKIRRVQDLQNGTVSNGILVNIRRMGARSYFQVDVGYERDAMLDIENGTEAEFIAMKLSPGDMLSGLTLTVNQKNSIRATPDIEHLWARTAGKVQQYLEPAWKLRTLELDDADGMVVTGRLANIKFVPYRPMPIYFFDVGCERPAALADGVGTEAEEYNALAAKLKVGDVLPDLVLKVNKKRRIMAVATLDSLRVATSIMEQLG